MSNNSNTSRDPFIYASHPDSVWYWTIRAVIAVIATTGNGLVSYIIISRRRLWTPANSFMLSLCIADLGTGIINTPLEFTCTMLKSCDIWLVHSIKDIFLLASVLNLCVITLDRFVAVRFSLKYFIILTSFRCGVVLVVTWMLSIATPFVFYVIIQYNRLETYRFVSLIRLFLCQLTPMVGLVVIFLMILRIWKSQRHKIQQQKRQITYNYSTPSASSRYVQRSSSIHFIGVMVIFFVVCYSLTFYRAFCNYVLFRDVDDIIVPISRLLYYLNSALDFAVYALFKQDINKELRNYFNNKRNPLPAARESHIGNTAVD